MVGKVHPPSDGTEKTLDLQGRSQSSIKEAGSSDTECCCSVTQLGPTLRPLGLQHARLPCRSLSFGVCSDSCPVSQWCHLTIILCPLLLLPSIFPSIRVFSSESALHIRWPEYWSFSFSISPSKEYSWLISFRMDWFDLLAVQGTLKSLLQHHNSKASVLPHPAFFIV